MTLTETIRNELARMLARQLDYDPAADELPFTIQVMADDLRRRGLTDDDSDRVKEAFRLLGPQTQRWPTSRMVMECLPSKAATRLLPAPKPDPKFVSAQLSTIKKSHALRSVFRPNESYLQYAITRDSSGLSAAVFEAQRLMANGWTANMERGFRDAAHGCWVGTLTGATPEQIAAASDPDAMVEREAIQDEA